MKEGQIIEERQTTLPELQIIIYIIYVITVGVGMLFNYQKFSEFGINIFDYADIFDFLIAPFSDFKILLFSIVSVIISYVLIRLDFFWKRKYPKSYSRVNFGFDKKSWFKVYRYFYFAVIVIIYLYLSADLYGSFVKKQIHSQAPINLRFYDNEIKKGILIGKTEDVLFLLENKKVKAIPISSLVKEFEIK